MKEEILRFEWGRASVEPVMLPDCRHNPSVHVDTLRRLALDLPPGAYPAHCHKYCTSGKYVLKDITRVPQSGVKTCRLCSDSYQDPGLWYVCNNKGCTRLTCSKCVETAWDGKLRVQNLPPGLQGTDLRDIYKCILQALQCTDLSGDEQLCIHNLQFIAFERAEGNVRMPRGLPIGTKCVELKATVEGASFDFKVATHDPQRRSSPSAKNSNNSSGGGDVREDMLCIFGGLGLLHTPEAKFYGEVFAQHTQGNGTVRATHSCMAAMLCTLWSRIDPTNGATSPAEVFKYWVPHLSFGSTQRPSNTNGGGQWLVSMFVELTPKGVTMFRDILADSDGKAIRAVGSICISEHDIPFAFLVQRRREKNPQKGSLEGNNSAHNPLTVDQAGRLLESYHRWDWTRKMGDMTEPSFTFANLFRLRKANGSYVDVPDPAVIRSCPAIPEPHSYPAWPPPPPCMAAHYGYPAAGCGYPGYPYPGWWQPPDPGMMMPAAQWTNSCASQMPYTTQPCGDWAPFDQCAPYQTPPQDNRPGGSLSTGGTAYCHNPYSVTSPVVPCSLRSPGATPETASRSGSSEHQ